MTLDDLRRAVAASDAQRRKTRVLSANVKGGKSPTGMHAGGRNSPHGPAADRITTLIRRANHQHISMIGTQECSGVQVRRVIERHPHWLPVVATPNEHFASGATIGNVLFLYKPVWDLDEHAEIEVAARVGSLHFVDALVTHRNTGRQLRIIDGHQPAGRRLSARQDRTLCESEVRQAIKGETLPIGLLFDFNTPTAFRGWDGARHLVDGALFRGVPTSAPRVHAGFVPDVGDHKGVSVVIDLTRSL